MVAPTALGPHCLIAVENGTFGESLTVHSRNLHVLPKHHQLRVTCGVKQNIIFAGSWKGLWSKEIDADILRLCVVCFGEEDEDVA